MGNAQAMIGDGAINIRSEPTAKEFTYEIEAGING